MTKMMRRAVLLLVATAATAILVAAPAGAQTFENDDDYAALCTPLVLSSSSVTAGDSVTVSGTAATGGATIAIVLDNATVLGETTSDATNHFFSTSVTIPSDLAAGNHTLQAFQLGDSTDPIVGCPAQLASIEVLGLTIQAPEEEALARTGSNSSLPLARVGFGLVAAGGLALVVSRRRKAAVAA